LKQIPSRKSAKNAANCRTPVARNARTSPEMIDRFYARHLSAEMNIGLLQSKRRSAQKPATATTAVKAEETAEKQQ
jgi:hypothetical protein